MNYLVLEENVDNDPCKFALMNRETSERVILQAANADIQQAWVQDINQVLETQRDFLNGRYWSWLLTGPMSGNPTPLNFLGSGLNSDFMSPDDIFYGWYICSFQKHFV